MEHELIQQIETKTREQYLATWGLIYRHDEAIKRAESEYQLATTRNVIDLAKYERRVDEAKRTLDTTWTIAARNKAIYDDEIEFLNDKLTSIRTNDVNLMVRVNRKNARFQLTGDYNATFEQVVDAINNYKQMISLETEDPRLTYYKLLFLFDLEEELYRPMIDECYRLAIELSETKKINIYNYIGAYECKYY